MAVRKIPTSLGTLPQCFAHAGDVLRVGKLIQRRLGLRRLSSQSTIAPCKITEQSDVDRKLRLVAQNSRLAPQLKDDAFGPVEFGQVDCAGRPGSSASAEDTLRLIKRSAL